jgi:hypothetical protein
LTRFSHFFSSFFVFNVFRLITLSDKCQFSKNVSDGMTVNDALAVVMHHRLNEAPGGTGPEVAKKNGASNVGGAADPDEDEEPPMPVEIHWGKADAAEHHRQAEVVTKAVQLQVPILLELQFARNFFTIFFFLNYISGLHIFKPKIPICGKF